MSVKESCFKNIGIKLKLSPKCNKGIENLLKETMVRKISQWSFSSSAKYWWCLSNLSGFRVSFL